MEGRAWCVLRVTIDLLDDCSCPDHNNVTTCSLREGLIARNSSGQEELRITRITHGKKQYNPGPLEIHAAPALT